MMEQRARQGFLGCDWCGNCDHPVLCRDRPVTTPLPRVTPTTLQVKRSLHDFAEAVGRAMLESLIVGNKDPAILADLAKRRLRS